MQNNWRCESWQEYENHKFSELVSAEFLELIESISVESEKQALKKQVFFSSNETPYSKNETSDPLGESKHAGTPFLIHQYKNRILLLVTEKCFSHCRYCFRKSYTSRPQSFIKREEIDEACVYLENHPNVDEVLISGGDVLTASAQELKLLLFKLRSVSKNIILRICTRAPIFAPSVFTTDLLEELQNAKPLWVIPHINHPAELGLMQRKCIDSILKRGIAMQSQSVLLKGVNDNPSTLINLFHTLTMLGIKPGYLFQLDKAFGTRHFLVPLDKALSIWDDVKKELSGLSMPTFAVDLNNGGGKFPLSVVTMQNSFSYDGKQTITKKECNKIYSYSTEN